MARARGRGIRTVQKVANAEESTFAMYLDELKRSGDVISWEYEPFSLKLGPMCHYTPDFVALHVDRSGDGKKSDADDGHEPVIRVVAYEVKGTYIRDDAAVKLKAAAERFKWMEFVLVQVRLRGGRNGNGSGLGRIEMTSVRPSDSLYLVSLPYFDAIKEAVAGAVSERRGRRT